MLGKFFGREKMQMKGILLSTFLLISITGCSSLILTPADFSWPVEDVLKINDKGIVTIERYTFSINVKQLFYAEFKDSTKFIGQEIRMIRDKAGYYFITAKGFKNVFLFLPIENGLKLENKIEISETEALSNPILNQESPNIRLIDGSKKYLLNNKGIVR